MLLLKPCHGSNLRVGPSSDHRWKWPGVGPGPGPGKKVIQLKTEYFEIFLKKVAERGSQSHGGIPYQSVVNSSTNDGRNTGGTEPIIEGEKIWLFKQWGSKS